MIKVTIETSEEHSAKAQRISLNTRQKVGPQIEIPPGHTLEIGLPLGQGLALMEYGSNDPTFVRPAHP